MSDYDHNIATAPFGQAIGRTGAIAVDEGLRFYLLRINNYMVLGLAVSGLAALGVTMLSVTTDPTVAALKMRDGLMLTGFGRALFASPLKWIAILAPLGPVLLLSFGLERLRPVMAHLAFWFYAALVGVSLATIFMVFAHTSLVRMFFVIAFSFGALSLWSAATQRELTGLSTFLLMGMFGIALAGLVNLFAASKAIEVTISVIGVTVFAGLTAWNTQRLKSDYLDAAMNGATAERTAIAGALALYLRFFNLFSLVRRLLDPRPPQFS